MKKQIENDKKSGLKSAKLAIILVGDNPASKIYVQNKIKAGLKVGIDTELKQFDIDLSEKKLLEAINILNRDIEISGIIISFLCHLI